MSGREERTRFIALQKKLYRHLKSESSYLLGKPDSSLLRYQAQCSDDLRGIRPHWTNKKQLFRSLSESKIILVADYHTLDQSSRTALRLLREFEPETTHKKSDQHWTLGLEMVASNHQKFLDQYLAGTLDETALEKALHHREHWGFPWHHYSPLLRWAKAHRARLLALNMDSKHSRTASLKDRDEWAAKVIAREIERRALSVADASRILVLFGDLHLTRSHLPRALLEGIPSLQGQDLAVIHQNLDSIYWNLAAHRPSHPGGIVELRKREFCIFSAPPWAKLASLLDWAELHPIEYVEPGAHRLEEDPLTEADLDPLSQVRTFYQTLGSHFQHPEKTIEDLTLLPKDPDPQDWRRIARSGLQRQELKLARQLHEFGFRFDLPGAQVISLGDGDRNSTAELAALLLLHQRQGDEQFFRPSRDDFERRVLRQTFAYLGSLLLNPRRKSELPEDHRRWLKNARSRTLSRVERIDAGARRALLRWVRTFENGKFSSRAPSGALTNWRTAVKLGQMFGYLLFEQWMLGEVTTAQIRRIFFKRWGLHPHGTRDALALLMKAVGKIPDFSLRAKEL